MSMTSAWAALVCLVITQNTAKPTGLLAARLVESTWI